MDAFKALIRAAVALNTSGWLHHSCRPAVSTGAASQHDAMSLGARGGPSGRRWTQ